MILALIQARMNSERLLGKSMLLLNGVPLIEHIVKRVHASQLVNYVCVATSDSPADDALAAHVSTLHNTDVFRGSEQDVLGRFFAAALRYPEADVIVRITADDYTKDPALIDYAIAGFLAGWADPLPDGRTPHYLHLGGITWALGADVEVFSRHALTDAHQQATKPFDREHVTSWMTEHLGVWMLKDELLRSTINTRFTLDTIQDYSKALKMYDALYPTSPLFGYDEALAWEKSQA